MFRLLNFVALLSIVLGMVFALHFRWWPPLPPLGKFLDPINGFWANSEQEPLNLLGKISVPGVQEAATVYWDEQSVPHIFANNTHDLYLLQGYVSAYHRLWQMDFQTYKAAGRLAEVLGPDLLYADRKQRRLGIPSSARSMCAAIMEDSTTRFILEAYTKGVNAYINSIAYDKVPVEYKLLDYLPEQWSPYKSCLVRKEMSSTLSLKETDMENSNMVRMLGQEMFDFLFPNNIETEGYVTEKAFDFTPLPIPEAPADNGMVLPPMYRALASQHGSNQLVVSKEKSRGGNVLMGAAPDLDLGLPSLWYFIHLHAPGYHVAGASLPGLPSVVIGANDSIAWSFTNAPRDLADWYAIRFSDATRAYYQYDSLLYHVKKVVEPIKVRDEEVFYDSVMYTHHGPVVYDHHFRANTSEDPLYLALRWAGHGHSNEFRAIHALAKSQDYEAYLSAIAGYEEPPQNIAFAAANGDIAIWTQGKYPLKWPQQGKFVMDGSRSRNDYRHYIPFSHNIYEKNPVQGFLTASNQAPVATQNYPYFLYNWWYERYRNRRINDFLNALNKVVPRDVMHIQNDNFNYIAYEFLPVFFEHLAANTLTTTEISPYRMLSKWDYFNHGDRVSPVYFQWWYDAFIRLLWDEFRDIEGDYFLPEDYRTYQIITQNPDFAFYDRVDTPAKESLQDLINLAYHRMLASVRMWEEKNEDEKLNWQRHKATAIRHLLRIPSFSVHDVAVGGGEHIVNAVKKYHGPSFRMVVELVEGGEPNMWFIYPGSQTGNPGNVAYAEWVADWANGTYKELLFTKDENKLRAQAIFTQRIVPEDL